MDTIEQIRAFAAVVATGSFTGAADRLGSSPQLVSKYVRALEESLDARLLHRTTRRVALTEMGVAFHERGRRLLEEFDELRAAVRDDRARARGHLVVAAPTTFGELALAGAARDFVVSWPEVTVELKLTDRFVDLIDEGVDLAIRIGNLEDSNLIAKRIATVPIHCCASPAYLEREGRPAAPEDLAQRECIVDTNFRTPDLWPFKTADGRQTVQVTGRVRVNSAVAVRDLALAGGGIALCPGFAVADDIRAGRLVTLFDEAVDSTLTLNAVYLQNRHLSAKVRSFVDFLAARFGGRSGRT